MPAGARRTFFSDKKKNLLLLQCNMVAVQNLYSVKFNEADQNPNLKCMPPLCSWTETLDEL